MKQQIIRHLESFAITFVVMLAMALAPDIYQAHAVSLRDGTMMAAVIAAARSAFKVAYELAIYPLFQLLLAYAKLLKNNNEESQD